MTEISYTAETSTETMNDPISPQQLKKFFPDASQSTIAANRSVPGRVQNPERKPASLPALVTRPQIRRGGKGRVVLVVQIIALRHRYADDDNIGPAGAKSLRDAIARSIGVDDGDPRIKWEYGVMQTIGPEQTIVKISRR